MLPFPLRPGDGWKSAAPHSISGSLLWDDGSHLRCSNPSFTQIETIARVPATPALLGAGDDTAFAYLTTHPFERPPLNAIHSLAPGSRSLDLLHTLPSHSWLTGFLAPAAEGTEAIGLLASGMPSRPGVAVRIEVQLLRIAFARRRVRVVPLPVDSLRVAGHDRFRDHLILSGASGLHCVDLTGAVQWRFRSSADVYGAAVCPQTGEVALGGAPLRLFTPRATGTRAIAALGINPAWSPDGSQLYFRRSSGDLLCWSRSDGITRCVVEVAINPYPESKYATAARLSPDGRTLVASLTKRAPRRGEVEPGMSAWSEQQCLLIADTEKQTFWTHPTRVRSWSYRLEGSR